MRVLVLGSGGREHALAWRLARDPDVTAVLAAPGNPGMEATATCLSVGLDRPEEVLALAARERVDLTVVGPEAPLERGLADRFRDRGRPIVGPSAAGAALECSKVFAKRFMARHRIPTAGFAVCESLEEGLSAVEGRRFGFPVVVKADGLAAGKGVVVAQDRAEAEQAVRAAMQGGQFGAAGSRLVVEECLAGPEVSFFVLCDGDKAVRLSTAQDHKRIWENDRGPNTGGMGAFAPSPLMTDAIDAMVMNEIVEPVLAGMRADAEPYRGFLYIGLMLTTEGPRVIEFNVRFGDPEAQVVLPLLEGPFARTLAAAASGRLAEVELTPGSAKAVGVVLASAGYPATSDPGREISGLERAAALPDTIVFHAGTRLVDGKVVTAGGRVLTVVGHGVGYEEAMARAYAAVAEIRFDGMQFRRDIGRKAAAAAAELR